MKAQLPEVVESGIVPMRLESGDCVIASIATALQRPYEDVAAMLGIELDPAGIPVGASWPWPLDQAPMLTLEDMCRRLQGAGAFLVADLPSAFIEMMVTAINARYSDGGGFVDVPEGTFAVTERPVPAGQWWARPRDQRADVVRVKLGLSPASSAGQNGLYVQGVIQNESTTASTSSTTGSAIIGGGIGAAGSIFSGGALNAGSDPGGTASYNTLTGASDLTANSTGVGSIKFKGTTSRDSSGFIKFYIGTTAYYVPVFSAITG